MPTKEISDNLPDLRGIEAVIARTVFHTVSHVDDIVPVMGPFKLEQASRYLRCSRVALAKAIRNGYGPKHTGAGKWLRITQKACDEFLASMTEVHTVKPRGARR